MSTTTHTATRPAIVVIPTNAASYGQCSQAEARRIVRTMTAAAERAGFDLAETAWRGTADEQIVMTRGEAEYETYQSQVNELGDTIAADWFAEYMSRGSLRGMTAWLKRQ